MCNMYQNISTMLNYEVYVINLTKVVSFPVGNDWG